MSERPVTHKMPEGVKSIACLGDSITQGYFDEDGLGWVTRLGKLLNEDKPLSYNTRNFGISGDTIFDAWHNLLSQVTHNNPDILIIKIGVNDVCIREGLRPESFQISRADSMAKWIKILTHAKAKNYKTIVVGPLPVEQDVIRFDAWEEEKKMGQTSFRYEQSAIENYNNDLEKLCEQNNIPFIRLFETWKESDISSLLIDGLHPNAKGHKLLAQQIFEKFKEIGF